MPKNKKFEPFLWKNLEPHPIIGVDEVGRGCLAGRVYAAAVILNENVDTTSFTDSKALSEKRREELAREVLRYHHYGIGFASVDEVDRLNILQASLLAMKRAVLELNVTDGHIIVDGNMRIPSLAGFVQTPLVKGDLRAAPVAAASILAKVTRDHYITEMASVYPNYGFEKHKGYSTQLHKSAIADIGPCEIHRRSFKGVREYLSNT